MNRLAQDALDLVAVLGLMGVLLIMGGTLVWLGSKLTDISARFLDRPRKRHGR